MGIWPGNGHLILRLQSNLGINFKFIPAYNGVVVSATICDLGLLLFVAVTVKSSYKKRNCPSKKLPLLLNYSTIHALFVIPDFFFLIIGKY